MTEPNADVQPLDGLIDGYLNGRLDEAGTRELESRLLSNAEARRSFVRYVRLHTDLLFELRARAASDRVMDLIASDVPDAEPMASAAGAGRNSDRKRPIRRLVSFATGASILALAVLGSLKIFGERPSNEGETLAWLVNAQNCTWTDGVPPAELRAGRSLRIDRGLAEVRFRCGTSVVIEGPAHLDLISSRTISLRHGKLTARVPTEAIGFEVISPQGKIIDLGTEFGMSVGDNGVTDVYVFRGKVEAEPAGAEKSAKVSLSDRQAARIESGQVTTTNPDPARFVRAIVPAPASVVERRKHLTFDRGIDGSIRDRIGVGTGLTHRLPGTGELLAVNDEYLRLDTSKSRLELTATRSDLNTQYRLRGGEYLGVRLSDLGFTGHEDFEVSAVFPETPALDFIGQFGLYAGARSDQAIRGGVLKLKKEGAEVYTQFLVNNADGKDSDLYEVGLLSPGNDLRLTLRRISGKYTLSVENLSTGGASTLAIRHPDYLDLQPELYVGLFAAEPRSDVGRKLVVKEFQAAVWVAAPAADR
jgi:hypothetical protein